MGPKPKKKGKKKSKAELEAERIQAEEDARKAEEDRIKREEKARREAEEAARLLREEQIAYRTEELQRLKEEERVAKDDIAQQQAELGIQERREREDHSWRKYLACNPGPDPSSEQHLNTFLSQEADTKYSDLNAALERCSFTEVIANDLLGVMHGLGSGGDSSGSGSGSGIMTQEVGRQLLLQLRDSQMAHIDHATAHLLQHWDEVGPKDDSDRVSLSSTSCSIRVGIWSNTLQKGGRSKNIDFGGAGMATDVPRPVLQAKVAVRNIFLPYEYVIPEQRRGPPGGHGHGPGQDQGLGQSLGEGQGQGQWQQQLQRSNNDNEGDGGMAVDGMAADGVNKDSPGGMVASSPYASNVSVLGGVFLLELLSLPPAPRQLKGWTFRPLSEVSHAVQRNTYPFDGGHLSMAPHLKAQFAVPEGVIVSSEEAPAVAIWDPEEQRWSSEGVSEVEWTLSKRVVRFHTVRIGSVALVQHRRTDLPYKNWSLVPVYDPKMVAPTDDPSAEVYLEVEPEVELTLATPRFMVVIRFKGNTCRLMAPQLPELAELRKGTYSPTELLSRLSLAGIMLLPTDDDASQALGGAPTGAAGDAPTAGSGPEVNEDGDDLVPGGGEEGASTGGVSSFPGVAGGKLVKDRVLEDFVCDQVAAVAASFEVTGSGWTRASLPASDRVAINVRETSVFTGGIADSIDFSTALLESDCASHSHLDAPGIGLLPSPSVKVSLIQDHPLPSSAPSSTAGGTSTSSSTSSLSPAPPAVGDTAAATGAPMVTTRMLPGHDTHITLLNCLRARGIATPEATERCAECPLRFRKSLALALKLIRPFSFSS